MSLLAAHGLSRLYGGGAAGRDRRTVLDQVTLDMAPGECVALLGMQKVSSRFPFTKKFPRPLLDFIHWGGGLTVQTMLKYQRLRGDTWLRVKHPPKPVKTAA